MINFLKYVIIDIWAGIPLGGKRSPKWNELKRKYLDYSPRCNACWGVKKLQVHHIKPFYSHPELELDIGNLITLCNRKWRRCHFIFGHFYNWRRINPNVVEDTINWNKKHANKRKRL